MKRSPSCQHFVEDDAQAEDVTATVYPMPFATGLLRTHVGRRPGVVGAVAAVFFFQRQSEIDDEWFAAGVDQNVPGFDVPVNESFAVSVVQRLGYRGDQFRCLAKRGPVVLDLL